MSYTPWWTLVEAGNKNMSSMYPCRCLDGAKEQKQMIDHALGPNVKKSSGPVTKKMVGNAEKKHGRDRPIFLFGHPGRYPLDFLPPGSQSNFSTQL